jgi:hypothetical protein
MRRPSALHESEVTDHESRLSPFLPRHRARTRMAFSTTSSFTFPAIGTTIGQGVIPEEYPATGSENFSPPAQPSLDPEASLVPPGAIPQLPGSGALLNFAARPRGGAK